ncbi:MAG TPA: Yip1 family protein [Dongiaceae bacterium]|jgi:hypothetical protein|nr:Yip1 family protein [Dongiaceae bacterium]
MIKALLFIFDSAATWERVVEAKRSFFTIFVIYVIPLLVLTTAVETYGLVHIGRRTGGEVEKTVRILPEPAMRYEAVQLGLSLVALFMGAQIIHMIGKSFHGRQTFTQAFTVVAYALGPLFTLRVLNAFPQMPPGLTWVVGIALTISVMYQGIPRVMLPDLTHSLGLFLLSALTLILITGLSCFLKYYLLKQLIHSGGATVLTFFPAVC